MWERFKAILNRAWSAVCSFFSTSLESLGNPISSSESNDVALLRVPVKYVGKTEPTKTRTSLASEGDYAANAKLTWDDVVEIRALKATGLYSNTQIAEMFSVTGSCIGRIISHYSWKIPRTKTLPTYEKQCGHCGKVFSNRSKDGVRVGPKRFSAAKFCSIECSRRFQIKKGPGL